MATSHAEIGVIEQAYREGKTQGQHMNLYVQGKDVCAYCRKDIALIAEKAGLKSITIHSEDNIYKWESGQNRIIPLKSISN